jgi:hypothetical protein
MLDKNIFSTNSTQIFLLYFEIIMAAGEAYKIFKTFKEQIVDLPILDYIVTESSVH